MITKINLNVTINQLISTMLIITGILNMGTPLLACGAWAGAGLFALAAAQFEKADAIRSQGK
jgi:hypothetical protein